MSLRERTLSQYSRIARDPANAEPTRRSPGFLRFRCRTFRALARVERPTGTDRRSQSPRDCVNPPRRNEEASTSVLAFSIWLSSQNVSLPVLRTHRRVREVGLDAQPVPPAHGARRVERLPDTTQQHGPDCAGRGPGRSRSTLGHRIKRDAGLNKKRRPTGGVSLDSVREGGLEPPCPHGHTDLNRARLPISPLALTGRNPGNQGNRLSEIITVGL